MPRTLLPLLCAGLLAAGAVLAVAKTPRAAVAGSYAFVESNDWRTVLVVNTNTMKYHRAMDGCYPSTTIGRDNKLAIADSSMKHAREQVEKLGCKACELCFK